MKNIGVEVAPEHTYGRAFLEGVAAFSSRHEDWRLVSITQESLNGSAVKSLSGMIIRIFGDQAEKLAKAAGIPIVDIYCEKRRNGVAQIHGDFATIGRMAADFFLARGFANFGWCGLRDSVFSNETGCAFERVILSHGHTLSRYDVGRGKKPVIVFAAPDRISDVRQLQKWLRALPKPAAVLCCNDHRAYQVIRVSTDMGISVPNDVAVLGIDNDSLLCSFAQIPISSIDPDAFRLGFSAARILSGMINRTVQPRPHHLFLSPPRKIIERQSTAFMPISPDWLSGALLAIEHNLSEGINAGDVFAIARRSPPSVERVFQEKFNLSVIGYIQSRRLNRAKDLLAEKKFQTKEIAAAAGFASSQYFCRAFKKAFGMSPGQFARSKQEEPPRTSH